jgi:hypothetical protein
LRSLFDILDAEKDGRACSAAELRASVLVLAAADTLTRPTLDGLAAVVEGTDAAFHHDGLGKVADYGRF